MVSLVLAAERVVLELRRRLLARVLGHMEAVLAVYSRLDTLFGVLEVVVVVPASLSRLHLREVADMQTLLLVLRLEVSASLVAIGRQGQQLDLQGISVAEQIEKYQCQYCRSDKALVVEEALRNLPGIVVVGIAAGAADKPAIELEVVLLPFDLVHSILEKKRLHHNCVYVADTFPRLTIAHAQHLHRK